MFYALLKATHLLAVIVWLGGIVFMLFFLRPAVAGLDLPVRVRLLHAVLARFLNAVVVIAVLTLGSGLWMWMRVARQTTQAGASLNSPLEWMVMAALGVLMAAILGHVRFALFKRLQRAVDAQDWPAGGVALSSIRSWVMVNLGLGLAIVLVVVLGASS
jgi:uncharacterized membrane protein